MGWEYYKPNQKIGVVGLTVRELLVAGDTQPETKYAVEMDCCGGLLVWTHEYINRQMRKRTKRKELKRSWCKACEHKKSTLQVKVSFRRGTAVLAPGASRFLDAPPPPSVPKGHQLWCDRMGMAW